MNATIEKPQILVTRSSAAYWRVTFDNPPLNVMGPQFVREFREIIAAVEADEEVMVLVFESAVEGFFLNRSDFNADLKDLTSLPQGPTGLEAWPDVLVRPTRMPVVSIALIRGRATGNGSEIASACDMSFASREKAVLSQWEVGVGLVAGGGPIARLPRPMGRQRALEVLLSSDDIGGDLAEAYGYVNRSLPDSELEGFVDALATRIASFDKWAIANTKRLVNAASLPPDVEIAAGWDACMTSSVRPAAQDKIKALFEQGFHRPGDAEDRLGVYLERLGHQGDAIEGRELDFFLPRNTHQKGHCDGFAYLREEYCGPRLSAISTRQSTGCRLCHRYSRQYHSQAPHERSADVLDRAIGTESLHVRARGTSNGRSISARAAWAGAIPSDGAVRGKVLFNGRRYRG